VSRQFEDAKHAHQTHNAQNGQRRRLLIGVMATKPCRQQRDQVGRYCQQVDAVEHVAEEGQLARATRQSDEQLEREPHDAQRFD